MTRKIPDTFQMSSKGCVPPRELPKVFPPVAHVSEDERLKAVETVKKAMQRKLPGLDWSKIEVI